MIIHQIVQLDMEHLALSGLSQIQEMENAWRLKSYQTSSKAWSAPNVSFVSSKWCVSSSTITSSLAWISYRYTCQDDHCHIWKKENIIQCSKISEKICEITFHKKNVCNKKFNMNPAITLSKTWPTQICHCTFYSILEHCETFRMKISENNIILCVPISKIFLYIFFSFF